MNAGDSNKTAPPKPPRGSASDDIAGYMPGHDVEVDDEDEPLPVAGPDVDFTKIEWDVSARDTDTGKEQSITVNATGTLSEEEIARIIEEQELYEVQIRS